MNKLEDMHLFALVVEEGSFAGASRTSSLTPAMVGRRVAALEYELGFPLLNRTTRSMSVTAAGKVYYEGCKRILSDVSELELSLTSQHHHNPSGLIRISAPDGLGQSLVQIIQEFRIDYPKIEFEFDQENQMTDPVDKGVDLTLQLSFDLQDTSLVATRLGDTTFGLYASPSYLDKKSSPSTLEGLLEHDCIHMGSSRYGGFWSLMVEGEIKKYRQPWVLVVGNTACLVEAVNQGIGIAQIPVVFAQQSVDSGKMIEIEGLAEFPTIGIFVMHAKSKHLPYRVTLFLEFLKKCGIG